VGKSTNSAVAARARTRDRRLAAGVKSGARDDRVAVAVTDVQRAQAAILTSREQAALAIAAARALEREKVAAAETIITRVVRELSGERLTIAQVAELIGIPPADVRRILRGPSRADGSSGIAR